MLPANLALVERPPQTGAACARDRMYTKRTLKALHDAPVGALLSYEALLGERAFEASDVISYGDHYYVVCDSSWAILRVHKSMPLLSAANAQIGAPQDGYEEGDSGFEALVHDATSDSIYVVRESVQAAPAGAGGAKAVSTRARALAGEDDDDDARRRRRERGELAAQRRAVGGEGGAGGRVPRDGVPARLRGRAHRRDQLLGRRRVPVGDGVRGRLEGLRGATSIRGKDGSTARAVPARGCASAHRQVGGRHCREGAAGKRGGQRADRGDGARGDEGGRRRPELLPVEDGDDARVPATAAFIDYSAIALHHSTTTVAVTSQENSQVWIGARSGGANGDFVPEEAKFEEGKVYDFPRDANCNLQYCNIERDPLGRGRRAVCDAAGARRRLGQDEVEGEAELHLRAEGPVGRACSRCREHPCGGPRQCAKAIKGTHCLSRSRVVEVVVASAAAAAATPSTQGAERQHLDDEVRLGLGVLGGLEQLVERELVGANEARVILTL